MKHEKWLDKHHRKCRSRGGNNSEDNIAIVRKDLHVAWHKLFGNATPEEVAEIISRTWIDPKYKLVAVLREHTPYQDNGN